jgi:hypothetical protein
MELFARKKFVINLYKYGFGTRDPRSGIRDPEKTYSGSRIRIQGPKGTGSRIRIPNTAFILVNCSALHSLCKYRRSKIMEYGVRSRIGATGQVLYLCGSGSIGSVWFWASRIRIHLQEVRILLSSSKNIYKTLDSYCFVTSL